MKQNRFTAEIKDFILKANRDTPYHRLLNMNITELAEGFCKVEMRVENRHLNPFNIAHGGVGFSLLDVAMGSAVYTCGLSSTTIEMNINYLKPSKEGDYLVGEGELVKEGNTILVAEGKLYRFTDAKTLAIARQTMMNLGPLKID